MKAVTYVRVSTMEQTFERQISDLKKYAKTLNLEIVRDFSDKISGYKKVFDDRQEFNIMIDYIAKNNITHILVSELSRISRQYIQTVNFIHECSIKGINIHIQKENLSTLNPDGTVNAMAQMMVGLLSSIASQESSTLSYRIKSGKMSGALCGKAYNGRLFVYDKVNGEQIVNEDKAQIVRKMFDMILEGNGCRKIAQYLNENHGEYKNGNWNSATVHSLIVNPFFMGKRRFKDVVMEVEPIVSEEIFEQAQAFLKSRFRFVSDSKHVNPFASFINCKCGATFTQTIIGSMRTDLYKCSNSCGVKSINRPYLISEVKALLEENAKLTQDKDERLKYNARIKLNVSLINSNLKRMFTLEKMSEKNYDLFTSEKINEKKFDEALLRYEDELVKLKDDNGRMLETNKAIKISLKNDILYYSDNLEIFKRQLLPILESIVIDEKYCTINMKGFSMMYFYIHRGHELQSYRGYIKKNGTSKGFKYNLNRDDLEDNTKMMIDNHLVPHLS